jgi:hypothetical protein
VEVAVDVDEPGYLVLLDSYDEGWSATVDGEAVTVQRANASFRAVPVPAGRSTVVFRYETPGLAAGLALAGLTVVAAGGAAGASVLRRRRARSGPDEPAAADQAGETSMLVTTASAAGAS